MQYFYENVEPIAWYDVQIDFALENPLLIHSNLKLTIKIMRPALAPASSPPS